MWRSPKPDRGGEQREGPEQHTADDLLLRIDAKDVGSNRRVAVVRGRVSRVEGGKGDMA